MNKYKLFQIIVVYFQQNLFMHINDILDKTKLIL